MAWLAENCNLDMLHILYELMLSIFYARLSQSFCTKEYFLFTHKQINKTQKKKKKQFGSLKIYK